MEPFGAIWSGLEPFGAIWSHLEPVGVILIHLLLFHSSYYTYFSYISCFSCFSYLSSIFTRFPTFTPFPVWSAQGLFKHITLRGQIHLNTALIKAPWPHLRGLGGKGLGGRATPQIN